MDRGGTRGIEGAGPPFLRATGLRPEELFFAPWRRPPRPPLEATPDFDPRECVRRLARVRSDEYGVRVEWHRAGLEWPMSRREARFWFAAFQFYEYDRANRVTHHDSPRELGERILDQVDLDSELQWPQVVRAFHCLSSTSLEAERLLVLSRLWKPEEILDQLLDPSREDEKLLLETAVGAAPYLVSQLEPEAAARYRRRLDTDNAVSDGIESLLAAAFGVHGRVKEWVDGWPDGELEKGPRHLVAVLFGLGDARELHRQASRLAVKLRSPWQIQGWLAHHGLARLDPIRESLTSWRGHKAGLDRLVATLARGDAPELAPIFLDLMVDSKVSKTARGWLLGHPRASVLGLASRLANRGKAASAAESLLRGLLHDDGELLEKLEEKLDEDELERLRGLGTPRLVVPSGELPPDLLATFASLPKGWSRKRPPKWLELGALPPVLAGDGAFDEDQVRLLLIALRESPLGEKGESDGASAQLIAGVAARAEPASLDAFARELFQQWSHAGAKGKDKWALHATGHFGGEASVLLLMPLLEKWRAQQQYQKTAQGVVTATAVAGRGGSAGDLVLMHFDRILRTTKRPSLRRQADEALDEIARRRGLTRAELMDRSIPHLGLGPGASYTVDYGSRRFELVIGADLKPRVRDKKGKLRATPPKPGVRDGEGAAGARAAFMELKKQLTQVLKIQSTRLEQAMVQARRWRLADFRQLLVEHPLMGLLVRRLILGFYAGAELKASFRLSAEAELLGVDDEPMHAFEGSEARVGLAHPLDLGEKERERWRVVAADYELVPPFPQLGRPIYELTPEEAAGVELKRFCGPELPSETLIFGLERLGWQRGPLGDGMGLCELAKPFYGHGLTAIVDGSMDGSVIAGGGFGDSHPGFLRHVSIVPGVFHTLVGQDGGYGQRPKPLLWGEAPPVVASEVLADLDFIARKAKGG